MKGTRSCDAERHPLKKKSLLSSSFSPVQSEEINRSLQTNPSGRDMGRSEEPSQRSDGRPRLVEVATGSAQFAKCIDGSRWVWQRIHIQTGHTNC